MICINISIIFIITRLNMIIRIKLSVVLVILPTRLLNFTPYTQTLSRQPTQTHTFSNTTPTNDFVQQHEYHLWTTLKTFSNIQYSKGAFYVLQNRSGTICYSHPQNNKSPQSIFYRLKTGKRMYYWLWIQTSLCHKSTLALFHTNSCTHLYIPKTHHLSVSKL